jgi:RecB family endonuclease NucS
MRLVIADCSVDYAGRLTAHLPRAKRLLLLKNDGSILVHSDSGSYKPLNWMNPPCTIERKPASEDAAELGVVEIWSVQQVKTADMLQINVYEIFDEIEHELGVDPGLQKDGVEAHLQELLAEHLHLVEEGVELIRREFFTDIGPVDILAKDAKGATIAIELKRRGDIDGVEQLARYLEYLNRDPMLAPVRGIFAAQEIKPQARTLAATRGIDCLVLDYDSMRGLKGEEVPTLF